ncbi:TetR family transcriptional regulator [Vibrio cholerae]|nr:TetR family transcriptional regulator [Vibrio cholerae]
MALRSSTKEKILDVAEGLFAEYGFNDTSLRTITSKAGVNLASVNYHFGDKNLSSSGTQSLSRSFHAGDETVA